MTRVSSFPFLFHWRRLLVMLAATLLLHAVIIDWLGNHIGSPNAPSPVKPSPAIMAQLRLDLPRPRPIAAAPVLQPLPVAAKPPVKPVKPAAKPAVQPIVPEPEPATATPDSPTPLASEAAPAAPGDAADGTAVAEISTGNTGAGKPRAAVAATPAPAAEAAAPVAEPAAAAAVQGRRYRVDLPASANFQFEAQRVNADGTVWNGEAVMDWQQDGQRYKVAEEVGISMLVARINLLVASSEGAIDADGLAPRTATEKRRGRAQTATHFNRDGTPPSITFSTTERSYPLAPGAQDTASVPFQLAGIGRADVNQFSGNIDIVVGQDKTADLFRFQLVGEDELDTKLGKLVAWHLTRPPRPGSYSSKLDIWLAPSLGWYPVQIRNTEASGALTTLTIAKLTPAPTNNTAGK